MRRLAGWLLAVCAVTAVPGRSRADIGLPIRDALPDMRFENLENYPQFDFYVRYAVAGGNPFAGPRIRRVDAGGAYLHFEETGRLGTAVLIAVPHGQPAPDVAAHGWDRRLSDGCLLSDMLPSIHAGKNARVSYRVHIADGTLEVTQSSAESTGSEWAGGASGPSAANSPWAVVGIVLGASGLGGLGVWLARRFVLPNR